MLKQAYLDAARSAAALLAEPAVAAAWQRPSALDRFSVAGLAGHLARQVTGVAGTLAAPVPAEPPVGLLDHYTRSPWMGADLDEAVHVGIRQAGQAEAAGGPAALAEATAAAADELGGVLASRPAGALVHLPWGPWSLTVDDYLTTRLMEIAVHSDDLAVSVGLPTPELPPAALEPVLALLARVAAHRHGPTAVLRALARAERAPATIAAL